jgi:gluconolactonase
MAKPVKRRRLADAHTFSDFRPLQRVQGLFGRYPRSAGKKTIYGTCGTTYRSWYDRRHRRVRLSNQRSIDVKSRKCFWFVAGLVMATHAALAQEVAVVDNVLGPEGPLYVDGNLYYVGWMSDTLSKWDGKTNVVLNKTPGCGHNGVALTKHKTFLIACSDHGAILEVHMTGKQLRRWDTDSIGNKLISMNDIVVTAADGAYATVWGPNIPMNEPPTSVIGRILYLAPGGKEWIEVANNLNYANGIGVSPDQKTLYVSETVGNCILKFSINEDGSLSNRSNFALLNLLTKNRVDSWWLGPDSMKIDKQGNIYVAQWFGGKVLKLSPAGKLLHQFDIAAGGGTTNVAFGEGEKELYVTVVKDPKDPQAKGSIVRIPNAE